MNQLSYLLEMSPGSMFWWRESEIHKQTVKKLTSCFLLLLFQKLISDCCCITLIHCLPADMQICGQHQQQPACLTASGDPDSHTRKIVPNTDRISLLRCWLVSSAGCPSWNLSQSYGWRWFIIVLGYGSLSHTSYSIIFVTLSFLSIMLSSWLSIM